MFGYWYPPRGKLTTDPLAITAATKPPAFLAMAPVRAGYKPCMKAWAPERTCGVVLDDRNSWELSMALRLMPCKPVCGVISLSASDKELFRYRARNRRPCLYSCCAPTGVNADVPPARVGVPSPARMKATEDHTCSGVAEAVLLRSMVTSRARKEYMTTKLSNREYKYIDIGRVVTICDPGISAHGDAMLRVDVVEHQAAINPDPPRAE
jgi:hypothetical protein